MSGDAKNKVEYGLEKAYYSLVTEDPTTGAVTYGTPIALMGAASLQLSAVGEVLKFYADNIEYFSTATNDGYEGDLSLALLSDQFRKDVLQETEDSKGVLFENRSAVTKKFALLFQFEGDIKATRHAMYYCSVMSRPEIKGETKADKTNPKTEAIKISCKPRPDNGFVKAKTTALTDPTAYDSWYTTVYQRAEVA